MTIDFKTLITKKNTDIRKGMASTDIDKLISDASAAIQAAISDFVKRAEPDMKKKYKQNSEPLLMSAKLLVKAIQENINHGGEKAYFKGARKYQGCNEEFFNKLLEDSSLINKLEQICSHRSSRDRKYSFFGTCYSKNAEKLRSSIELMCQNPYKIKKMRTVPKSLSIKGQATSLTQPKTKIRLSLLGVVQQDK